MTLVDQNRSGALTAWMNQTLQLRWPSTRVAIDRQIYRRLDRTDFVLALQLLSAEHAVIEAWIDRGQDRQDVLARQTVAVTILVDHDLVHIDVMSDGLNSPRVVAMSLTPHESGPTGHRLVYAQTPLLGIAGLPAGSYGSPNVSIHRSFSVYARPLPDFSGLTIHPESRAKSVSVMGAL